MDEKNLAKTYGPKEFEERIYKNWEESGAFRAEVDKNKKPFTIMMPPPNITGQLHIGHALDLTLQDVLTRWKRLQGFSALWLPGSDHASIATEVKVVERIKKEEGKAKEELGREEFMKRAWAWKDEFGGKITQQARKMGFSCDWSRERFTLDEGCNHAVNEVFVKLYEKGLIYRGNRLINWCPSCGTTLSDAEVEHEDKSGKYYYIKYPAADGGEGLVLATSRPETMFGDVAVAVHPEDDRYKSLVGKMLKLPLTDREIPVIADSYPDPEKGTGAVKITPAHDPNDFEVGQRHNLEQISCLNPDATINQLGGKYEGMERFACRKALVADLEAQGYLVKVEEKVIPVGGCYRCDTVIEPRLSEQWFVKMQELAQPAIEAVKKGDLQVIPERFEKTYLQWLENIRDWCISRQLWWGHRIPAYYCDQCGEMMVEREAPHKCSKCGSTNLRQDEDVLDTWFSSALWPFSTLGWPEKTEDLAYFYPTDVLVTGYDIIFFWVVRMVFSGLEMMGEVPFKYAYIHGLVRDAEGRKMSKSLGNGVDPLEVIDQYGADALRFMLTTGVSAGADIRYQTEKIESARNFANKLWNASRFVIMNLEENTTSLKEIPASKLRDEDKWILSRVNTVTAEATVNMEKFEFALAGQKVYELIWNEYCDWYIEIVKSRLYADNEEEKDIVRYVLVKALKDMLRLLHPYMPYITEEIWSFLPDTNGFLMKDQWPVCDKANTYDIECEKLELAMETIRAIRNIRAEAEAAPSKKLKAIILSEGKQLGHIKDIENIIKNLANITEMTYVTDKKQIPEEVMSAVIGGVEIFVALDDLVDYANEVERLSKEQKKLEGEVARINGKLSNQGFVGKAPASVIEEEKAKLANYEDMLAKVTERLAHARKKVEPVNPKSVEIVK